MIEVPLTQKHIDEGEIESAHHCPISLALNDHNNIDAVFTDTTYVEFLYQSKTPMRVELNEHASEFLEMFDQLHHVYPGTLYIDKNGLSYVKDTNEKT